MCLICIARVVSHNIVAIMASSFTYLLLISSSLLLGCYISISNAQSTPPLVKGLSWSFYRSSCPKLESIVRKHLKKILKKDISLAAGLLRIHFHDCFVQGCDGSVLLDGKGQGEQASSPNLTLRKQGFKIINDLLQLVHKKCGRVVSCSDITALAARDSIALSGGPDYKIPLGRRDGFNFATNQSAVDNLPKPSGDTTRILNTFAAKNLDATDTVALSGGHTIGIGHCTKVTARLFPTPDPNMDKTFAKRLREVCPANDIDATTVIDIRSPNKFDNNYFLDLINRQGLFNSDQDLYTDRRTRPIVTSFAVNQSLFFEKFAFAMIKMSQLSVLTGTQGEIRVNCSARNSARTCPSSVVHGE